MDDNMGWAILKARAWSLNITILASSSLDPPTIEIDNLN